MIVMDNMIYCNPINLPYHFQQIKGTDYLYREGADPSVVLFEDKYWMFTSMTLGAWYSEDLVQWEYKDMKGLPHTDYAPDVRVIGDYVYFTASRKIKKCSIYRSKDLNEGKWEKVSTPFPFWDPHLFEDDDGKVFLYWGCSNKKPIYGVEMDGERFVPKGKPSSLLYGMEHEHGWERVGDNNRKRPPRTLIEKMRHKNGGARPYIEGPWMNKFQGRYYLQYAGPGTEYNIYADGVYVSDSPLGPFHYQQHNPYSLKPGGFINGAGHGSTFYDKYNNLWHATTMVIGKNYRHERRIGIFPANFDGDGLLNCNTSFGDYPTVVPNKALDGTNQTFAEMMLLSYNKRVKASSCRGNHVPENVVDENIKTLWVADSNDKLKVLEIDLGDIFKVKSIQVNFAEYQIPHLDIKPSDYNGELPILRRAINKGDKGHKYIIHSSCNGKKWAELVNKCDNNRQVPHDFVVLSNEREARYIRITCIDMPFDSAIALSGVRVFGTGSGKVPEQISKVLVSKHSEMDVKVQWDDLANAQGYNVRWGIAPDKLYSSWMVYGKNEVMISSLSKGVKYWGVVDAFNENGIQKGKVFRMN